jgi:hypothetical protein
MHSTDGSLILKSKNDPKEDSMSDKIFAGLAIPGGKKGVNVCILFPESNSMVISTSIPEIVQGQHKLLHGKSITYKKPAEHIRLKNGKYCRLLDFSEYSIEAFKHALERNNR